MQPSESIIIGELVPYTAPLLMQLIADDDRFNPQQLILSFLFLLGLLGLLSKKRHDGLGYRISDSPQKDITVAFHSNGA